MIRSMLRPASRWLRRTIRDSVREAIPDTDAQQIQRGIVNQYLAFKATGTAPYRDISDSGFRVNSQFEEDGIILYVLSMIGFKTRHVVEMCCGNARECMATNLIVNHRFNGTLFDGGGENIRVAREFFKARQDCLHNEPTVVHAWITAENVNDLLTQSDVRGEVDVFSLDVDGNDYWILKAIDVMQPRLIVAETQNIIPSELSLTIKYKPDFDCTAIDGAIDYRGASLLAMTKLCRKKGYRLIGAHRLGFNAFFLRNGEGDNFFPEISIEEIHNNKYTRWSQKTRWPVVRNMDWQLV